MTTLIVQTDGGARGNPGPAAAAIVFSSADQVHHQEAKLLGRLTNNQAEYQALLLALHYLDQHRHKYRDFKAVDFYLDSELVVKQIRGEYKIKHPDLQPLAVQVFQLLSRLPYSIKFHHVKRHLNRLPDKLLNQALDGKI